MQHKTANGKVIDIECLEDSHLVNIINFNLKQMQEAKAVILGGTSTSRDFLMQIEDVDRTTVERAKGTFQKRSAVMGFYLHEAMIRGMDVSGAYTALRALFERSARRLPTNMFSDRGGRVASFGGVLNDFEEDDFDFPDEG